MIIKSIKVFVEWKFYTRLNGPGPDLADSWLEPVTPERERETAPQCGVQATTEHLRDKAGHGMEWYQRVNHSALISDSL